MGAAAGGRETEMVFGARRVTVVDISGSVFGTGLGVSTVDGGRGLVEEVGVTCPCLETLMIAPVCINVVHTDNEVGVHKMFVKHH